MSKPKIVSLFSGGGGIDLGFHKAGFETVFATDIWSTACETLKVNYPKAEVECNCIEGIDFKRVKQTHGKIHGLVGGPPCPAFSKSRFYRTEKKRGLDDENGYLTVTNYFRAVEELDPEFFMFENVHGFVYKPHQDALEYLKSESERLGYNIVYKVVNSADYGVPQTRERFICVGTKKSKKVFIFPEQTHINIEKINLFNGNLKPWITAGDAIGDIDYDLPEDENMKAGSKDHELLKQIPPGDNYLFFTENRGYPDPKFKWRSRYWSFLLKLSPDRPSWTIQASFSNNMGPFHWKNRFLRIQEIKRLQTFDDDYFISGDFREQWRQIGNAVPPLLVFRIAARINEELYNGGV